MLETFNQVNGALGTNWAGATSGYTIVSNASKVGMGNTLIWQATRFGMDQEVFVTLASVDSGSGEQSLFLKSQNPNSWGDGVLKVQYDTGKHLVRMWTFSPEQGWVQQGSDIPLVLRNGDQFGARARSNGIVEVYRNGVLVGTYDASAWTFAANGGYIGLWFSASGTVMIDDFGGGTLPP